MWLIINPISSAASQGLIETGHQGLPLLSELIDELGQARHVVAAGETPLVLLQLGLRPVEIVDGNGDYTRADLPAEITLATAWWGAEAQHLVPVAASLTAPLLQQAQGGVGHN